MRTAFSLFFVLLFLSPTSQLSAAHLFLDAEEERYSNNQSFYIPVRIDTQGECINAVRVAVAYNPEVLSVKDVSTGDSVISLWVTTPTIEMVDGKEVGRVVFEGGIPGGYCGRVLGDPGTTNTLVTLVVTGAITLGTRSESDVVGMLVVEPQSVVYRNDGSGAPVELTFSGAEFLVTHSTTSPQDVWFADVRADSISPQDFEVQLVEGPSVGNKKHYIVFNTTDKQSGMSHYEVLETDPDKFGFLTWIPKEAHWVVAESPYVLRDQKLRSKIMVKAVDKNGNERIVTYTPPMTAIEALSTTTGYYVLALLAVTALLLAGVVVLLRKRKQRTNHSNKEQYENSTEV